MERFAVFRRKCTDEKEEIHNFRLEREAVAKKLGFSLLIPKRKGAGRPSRQEQFETSLRGCFFERSRLAELTRASF